MSLCRVFGFVGLMLSLSPTLVTAATTPMSLARADRLTHTGWTPANRRALAELVREKGRGQNADNALPPPVVTLDWDNTMILNDIGEATYLYLVDTLGFSFNRDFWRLIPSAERPALRRHYRAIVRKASWDGADPDFLAWRYRMASAYPKMCETAGEEACYTWLVKLLAGLKPHEVRAAAKNALARELNHAVVREDIADPTGNAPAIAMERGIRYYAEMADLTREFHDSGFAVWVISASAQWMVEAAAEGVGIAKERVLGMLPKLDSHGAILAEMARVTYRQGKADAIRDIIGRSAVFAAGDSNTDIEMLVLGHGLRLVIDRGKHPLMDIAASEGWLVQPCFLKARRD